MNKINLPNLLFILGIVLIVPIIVIKNVSVGISFAIIGLFLIMLSWFLPIYNLRKVHSEELIDNFIVEISELLALNEDETNLLKDSTSKSCSIRYINRSINDLSKKTGLTEKLLSDYFKATEQDDHFKKNFESNKFETILRRKYDIGLVGSIFNDLKIIIKDSDEETLKKEISYTIEIYSERYSLSNSIECQNPEDALKEISLVNLIKPFEFVEAIIRKRFAVPHYESNIFAFNMFLYMLDKQEMESKIEKNEIRNIISKYLNLLIIESQLRDIFLENLERLATLYLNNSIKKDNIYNLITRELDIYMKTLNITRKNF